MSRPEAWPKVDKLIRVRLGPKFLKKVQTQIQVQVCDIIIGLGPAQAEPMPILNQIVQFVLILLQEYHQDQLVLS